MGILGMIAEQKRKFKENFEKKAEERTIERLNKLSALKPEVEKRQFRADVKRTLQEEQKKNRELKYAGIKNVFNTISQGIKETQKNKRKTGQKNKRKTGVLFGKGLSKKRPIKEDIFSNKGIFYQK